MGVLMAFKTKKYLQFSRYLISADVRRIIEVSELMHSIFQIHHFLM